MLSAAKVNILQLTATPGKKWRSYIFKSLPLEGKTLRITSVYKRQESHNHRAWDF